MSGFFGAAQPLPQFNRGRQDYRLYHPHLRPEEMFADIWAIATASFQNEWWPGACSFLGEQQLDVPMIQAIKWQEFYQQAGASSSYGFVGVTRDKYGSPLGGVTVKGFLTATDTKVLEVISDVNGEFLLPTPYYPNTHYLLFYKTGSPDVFGTSPNTLIGT